MSLSRKPTGRRWKKARRPRLRPKAGAGRFAHGDAGCALCAGTAVRITVTALDRPGHAATKTETK